MRGPWQYEDPLCAEVGQHFFFPDKEDNPVDVKYAKSVCNSCIHKGECLAWAVVNSEQFGIWGGTSPKERQHIRSKKVA